MAAQGFVTKNTEALFSEEVANLGDKRVRKVAAESCLLLGSLLWIRRKRKRAWAMEGVSEVESYAIILLLGIYLIFFHKSEKAFFLFFPFFL